MARKLFCEISPLTYRISTQKCIAERKIRDAFSSESFAHDILPGVLPVTIYRHSSLIRRTLGDVDPVLQENKAVNLSIAAPLVSGVVIRPGETFSFWHLVGCVSAEKGYKTGLTIKRGLPSSDVGGGMCRFTNLIHWMVLHSPLEITEHHHHDGVDLFPDFGRKVPFGTGTSILYNYMDYRFKNNTDSAYQLIVYLTDTHLCGELRSEKRPPLRYHILVENEHFSRENGIVYRNGTVLRRETDPITGNCVRETVIRKNHARVMYDTSGLNVKDIDMT